MTGLAPRTPAGVFASRCEGPPPLAMQGHMVLPMGMGCRPDTCPAAPVTSGPGSSARVFPTEILFMFSHKDFFLPKQYTSHPPPPKLRLRKSSRPEVEVEAIFFYKKLTIQHQPELHSGVTAMNPPGVAASGRVANSLHRTLRRRRPICRPLRRRQPVRFWGYSIRGCLPVQLPRLRVQRRLWRSQQLRCLFFLVCAPGLIVLAGPEMLVPPMHASFDFFLPMRMGAGETGSSERYFMFPFLELRAVDV